MTVIGSMMPTDPEGYDHLIGQVLTEELETKLREENEKFRVFHPGGIYTQDFNINRLNVRVDSLKTRKIIGIVWK